MMTSLFILCPLVWQYPWDLRSFLFDTKMWRLKRTCFPFLWVTRLYGSALLTQDPNAGSYLHCLGSCSCFGRAGRDCLRSLFLFVNRLHCLLKLLQMQWQVVLHSPSGASSNFLPGRFGSPNATAFPTLHLPTFHFTALLALIFHATSAWHRSHWSCCCKMHCLAPDLPFDWRPSVTILELRQLSINCTHLRCH